MAVQVGLTPKQCSPIIISFLVTSLSSFHLHSFKCVPFKVNYCYFLLLFPLLPAVTFKAVPLAALCQVLPILAASPVFAPLLSAAWLTPMLPRTHTSSLTWEHLIPQIQIYIRAAASLKNELKPQRANLFVPPRRRLPIVLRGLITRSKIS